MGWVARWLSGSGRGRHAHPPSAGGPGCFDAPPPAGPGFVVRALGALCYAVAVLTFTLCLAAMLCCLVSLAAGLFTG
jgi:hypothetical protein